MKRGSLLGAVILFIWVLLLLFNVLGCSAPITAVQVPIEEPSLIALWKHDSKDFELEFLNGTYVATYGINSGYGQWEPLEGLDGIFAIYNENVCQEVARAYYSVTFTSNRSMRLFADHDTCSGRANTWTGPYTRRF